MRTQEAKPAWQRAIEEHGLSLEIASAEEFVGDCPWCGAEKHWYVNRARGVWVCHKCGVKGNPETFLGELWPLEEEVLKAKPGMRKMKNTAR